MTPEQYIKREIIGTAILFNNEYSNIDKNIISTLNKDNIDEIYSDLFDSDESCDSMTDAFSEIRCSGIETGLSCDCSRHYESDAVAICVDDNKNIWVGWTYWYGGGKHGDPDEMDWMDRAYFLSVEEEEVVTIKRTFTKIS